jgi:hypothetical protein
MVTLPYTTSFLTGSAAVSGTSGVVTRTATLSDTSGGVGRIIVLCEDSFVMFIYSLLFDMVYTRWFKYDWD